MLVHCLVIDFDIIIKLLNVASIIKAAIKTLTLITKVL